jgi:hypothetical protein
MIKLLAMDASLEVAEKFIARHFHYHESSFFGGVKKELARLLQRAYDAGATDQVENTDIWVDEGGEVHTWFKLTKFHIALEEPLALDDKNI